MASITFNRPLYFKWLIDTKGWKTYFSQLRKTDVELRASGSYREWAKLQEQGDVTQQTPITSPEKTETSFFRRLPLMPQHPPRLSLPVPH